MQLTLDEATTLTGKLGYLNINALAGLDACIVESLCHGGLIEGAKYFL